MAKYKIINLTLPVGKAFEEGHLAVESELGYHITASEFVEKLLNHFGGGEKTPPG